MSVDYNDDMDEDMEYLENLEPEQKALLSRLAEMNEDSNYSSARLNFGLQDGTDFIDGRNSPQETKYKTEVLKENLRKDGNSKLKGIQKDFSKSSKVIRPNSGAASPSLLRSNSDKPMPLNNFNIPLRPSLSSSVGSDSSSLRPSLSTLAGSDSSTLRPSLSSLAGSDSSSLRPSLSSLAGSDSSTLRSSMSSSVGSDSSTLRPSLSSLAGSDSSTLRSSMSSSVGSDSSTLRPSLSSLAGSDSSTLRPSQSSLAGSDSSTLRSSLSSLAGSDSSTLRPSLSSLGSFGSGSREFSIPSLLGSNNSNPSKFTIPSLLSLTPASSNPGFGLTPLTDSSSSRLESLAELHLSSSSTPNLNSLANLHLSSNHSVSLLGGSKPSPLTSGGSVLGATKPSPLIAGSINSSVLKPCSEFSLTQDIDLTSALKSIQPLKSVKLNSTPEQIKPETVLLLVDISTLKSNLREKIPSSFGKVIKKRWRRVAGLHNLSYNIANYSLLEEVASIDKSKMASIDKSKMASIDKSKMAVRFQFNEPSPDDVVKKAQSQSRAFQFRQSPDRV
ncbi:mediator of RNA polymerase II transcription subunit 1 isoform X2 [Eurytemora carolleeae]|uniref:mediator of RNA polymerase II transcription subunit 1 isoform X2 n=1 Tax=Eurytemora carolleeae TaxID=1294199 RepID=UPI000C7888B3|nr:mediator of RNA polymerase II transcription subunit 1 isoform X2 [Eurytemora carolleeae]|eukprot:XP_023327022.1 mediator of RNA polymerase II transcription subunit 1-like isoform X2 [Eurytemora affinis]